MLISESYREQQAKLHEKYAEYGSASVHAAPVVAKLINQYQITDLLDYGAGKLRLFKALKGLVHHKMRLQAYEPAAEDLALRLPPNPAQMVVCIDVLEHIEPEHLDAVLDDLHRVTKEIGFFTISTVPAKKTLEDGRNAHLIQEGPEFWLPKLLQRFDLQTFQKNEEGFFVLVTPLIREEERIEL